VLKIEIISLFTTLSFILFFSEYLEKTVEPRIKNKIVFLFISLPKLSIQDIIRNSNKIFLNLFDHLYIDKTTKFNASKFLIWSFFFVFYFTAIFTPLYLVGLERTIGSMENILIFSLFCVILFVLLTFPFFLWLQTKSFKYLLLFFVWVFLFNYFTDVYDLIQIYNWDLSLLFILILFFVAVIINFVPEHLFNISPIRTMISSILAVAIIALIKIETAKSFLVDFNQIGIILLANLFLNIFIDSISIWETKMILRKASSGSIFRFISFVFLDILLSALIFLAIPFFTLNLRIFIDAIFFSGERPWLGILFWSTFFTSIIFYLYISSIFSILIFQIIIKQYNKLDGILPIKQKPIRCLGLISTIPVFLFWIIIS